MCEFVNDFMGWFSEKYSFRYTADICYPPTYLSHFIPANEKILLIHNSKQKKSPVRRSSSLTFDDHLDLTGSPLKIGLNDESFNACEQRSIYSWLKTEEDHNPIEITIARDLLNIYNLSPQTLNISGIFVICDQNDLSEAVVLGSSGGEMSLENHMISHKGYHARTEDCLSLQTLVDQHKNFKKSLANIEPKVEISCTHQILGSCVMNPNTSQPLTMSKSGSVTLEIGWNKLQYKVPEDAITTAVVQCDVGNGESEAILLSSHLEQIQKYIDYVEQYNNDEELQKGMDFVLNEEGDEGDLFSSINDVFQKVGELNQLRRLAKKQHLVSDSVFQSTSAVYTRTNLDFTDSLWPILTQCNTYSTLAGSFEYIISVIVENNFNPYLCDDNQTKLAVLIRNVKKGLAIVKCLSGNEPILMLIEIGIEKMRKDYLYVFKSSNLQISDYLIFNTYDPEDTDNDSNLSRKSILPMEKRKTLLKARPSIYSSERSLNDSVRNFNQKTDLNLISKHMTTLAKIHTVLELLLIVEANLPKLSRQTFTSFTEEALKTFTGPKSPVLTYPDLQEEPSQLFKFPIPTKELTLGDKEKVWKLSLTSANDYMGIKSVFVQSTDPIFPPLLQQNLDSVLDANETYNQMYFCSEYKLTWAKFGEE